MKKPGDTEGKGRKRGGKEKEREKGSVSEKVTVRLSDNPINLH
jgi:hypothetical protein